MKHDKDLEESPKRKSKSTLKTSSKKKSKAKIENDSLCPYCVDDKKSCHDEMCPDCARKSKDKSE